MSKVNLEITGPKAYTSLVNIPKGTYFTCNVEGNAVEAFLKGYSIIIALEGGETYDENVRIYNCHECDATICLEPTE